MATTSAAQVDALFLQYHEQVVYQQFPQATPFYSMLGEAGKEWQTNQKGWKGNAYLRQEGSNKWGLPGMEFPNGRTMVDKNYYVYRAKYAKSHKIDGSTYNDLKRGNMQTIINEAEYQRRLLLNAAHEMEQACTGDGTGKKAQIASATTTVLTLATTPNGTHARGFGAEFLIEEAVYDILTSAGALGHASHENVEFPIASIDRVNNTVTLSSALGAAPANDSIIVYADSYNQYPEGLRSLIDGGRTGEFQGLDASVEPYLNSAKIDADQNDISVVYVQNLMVKHTYFNGGEAGMKLKALTSPTQLASYTSSGHNQVRYGSNEKDFNLGFNTASFGGVNFQALVSLDPDVFMLADLSDLRKLVGKKLSVHSEDGLVWRQVQGGTTGTGYDQWYIVYGYEGNQCLTTPRRHAVMVDLGRGGYSTAAQRFGTA